MNTILEALRVLAASAAALAVFCVAAQAAGTDAASIQPIRGLVVTSTVHSAFVVSGGGAARAYSGIDVEEWDSVASANADAVDYRMRVSAPANARANTDLSQFVLHRSVRRQDIAQSTRINLFYSSNDPGIFAGQTFLETSVKALAQLKSGKDVPYVIGVIDGENPLGGVGAMLQGVASQPTAGQPGTTPLAGLASLLATSAAHTYYRGSLRRVEGAPVMLPVLLNGARVSLPAIHAQGTVANGDKAIQMQFWWLDSPAWPLTLKWSMATRGHAADQQVTKIDLPTPQAASATSVPGGATNALAHRLQTACHLELSGIYFNTGSALLLPESQPALRQIAQVVRQSGMPVLEVQGHTDNIGTAAFNEQLSQQRAAAVRQALVTQFGIAPGKLTSKGFGFTRPVESNDTVAGRARNRRVELACPGAH
ncbi:MAG: OmpA family protein [Proteobacteria bacterium]|nr:OmpA family protein [Pseudomonadota bacterium]